MSPKKQKAILLFDLSEKPPADQNWTEYLRTEAWDTERDVLKELDRLGFEAKPLGIFDDHRILTEAIERETPDLIFNLAESFADKRAKEPYIAGLLDLSGIPFTGASPPALMVCKNKGLAKKILSFHRIRTPQFIVSYRARPLRSLKRFAYPAFVKPLGMEGSDGISKDSFAENEKDCMERIRFVHEKLQRNAIIEEFVEGRELYVGVWGKNRPCVFPPRELFFGKVPEDEPKFATAAAKWDMAYRKRWGIRSGPAAKIEEKTLQRLQKTCRRAYQVLGIDAYARLDLRLTSEGEIYVIEVNPNPFLSRDEDFAKSAKAYGWEYTKLIDKITQLGLSRAREEWI